MKYQLKDYQDMGKKLKERLELETDIVAVKFIKNIADIPEGFLKPVKDTGKKMTPCQAQNVARREGKYVSITGEDNPCAPISVALGWVKVGWLPLLKSQRTNGWQKNLTSVLRTNFARYRLGGILAQWPLSRVLGYRGMLVAPLSNTPFIPDTVVVYGNPEQMTHVAQSLSFEGKHVPRGAITGFGDSCWGAAFFPLLSKNPVFVLLGMGNRSFGGVTKNEVATGMPGSMVFYLDENMFKAGGEKNNLQANLKKKMTYVDEDTFPGWRDVRNLIKE